MKFDITDMSCGHCVGAITQAIGQADSQAKVEANLVTKQISVTTAKLSEEQMLNIIKEAGYTATPAKSF